MRFLNIALLPALLTALLTAILGAGGCARDDRAPGADPSAGPDCTFEAVAGQTLSAIAQGDFETLASLTHPDRGVRLSPYATVDPATDRVLTIEQLRLAGTDHATYLWGASDGTGDAIELSCPDYFRRFVYSHDFLGASQSAADKRLGVGNSIDNIAEVYPDGRFMEYHVPGQNPDYGGMDWGSLRLVFVEHGRCWKLVGIVHDQWTI